MSSELKGVSPSQLDAMSCRMAWHLGYRLGYRSLKIVPALDLGTGVHLGLEKFYAERKDPVKAFKGWVVERRAEIPTAWDDDLNKMAEVEALGIVMLEGYVDHYGDDEELEVIATEHTLTRQIPDPETGEDSEFYLKARLDGIVRHVDTGNYLSLEHKTYGRLDTGHFGLNHQFTAQVWLGQDLAATLGIEKPIVGVLYNGLRKQAPGPRVKGDLFHRENIFRNQEEINSMLFRAYHQCAEVASPDVAIYPQPNPMRCGYCAFKEVCTEWSRGGDYQFLLDNLFAIRTDGRFAPTEEAE
jgi:hypothetical protein